MAARFSSLFFHCYLPESITLFLSDQLLPHGHQLHQELSHMASPTTRESMNDFLTFSIKNPGNDLYLVYF